MPSRPGWVLRLAVLPVMISWASPTEGCLLPVSPENEGTPSAKADDSKGRSAAGKDKAMAAGRKDTDTSEKPLAAINMKESGYVEKLLKVDEKEATEGGVKMKAAVVPDAYRYYMARGLVEFEEAGYEGAKLESKLRSLHATHSKFKGRVLFLVSLSTGGETYFLLTNKVQSHVELSQQSKVTFTLLKAEPQPQLETWKCFDGTGSGFKKRALCALQKLDFQIYTGSLKSEDKEPIKLAMGGVLVHSKSNDPNNSINAPERQISTKHWDRLFIKGPDVTFTPGRWKIPKPPRGFDELLKRVGGGK